MTQTEKELKKCKVAFAEERLRLLDVMREAKRLAQLLNDKFTVRTELDKQLIKKYLDSD